MQGKDETIVSAGNKIEGFKKKICDMEKLSKMMTYEISHHCVICLIPENNFP